MISLKDRVAIVTGAGAGLGKQHALLLAKLGAKVVVNDLGSNVNGTGQSHEAATAVVNEIIANGGEAMINTASVTDYAQVEKMVQDTLAKWGRIDILVNNAGILRDKTFSKMSLDDFRVVVEVHLMGAVNCTKAVWDTMKAQKYGRIVMTTSSSGLYGNFGQSNYSAAKMALVGLMQTLGLEGEKYNVLVNSIAPTAATRMLEGLMPEDSLKALSPEKVSPALAVLVSENAPNRTILCAGAGSFEAANITMTKGIHVQDGSNLVNEVHNQIKNILDMQNAFVPVNGLQQGDHELKKAGLLVKG